MHDEHNILVWHNIQMQLCRKHRPHTFVSMLCYQRLRAHRHLKLHNLSKSVSCSIGREQQGCIQ